MSNEFYSASMNRIEDQWHQLISHEIAGQMFEDEYDLAMCQEHGNPKHSQWIRERTF